jgi:mevalonate kinase
MGDAPLQFYAHGKLLITAEYLVLDDVPALALPCKLGQRLEVLFLGEHEGQLNWRAFTSEGTLWIDAVFSLEDFAVVQNSLGQTDILQQILRAARAMNAAFLQEIPNDIRVNSYLEFPNDWGLGSSSTLISMIAQWAEIDPFLLLQKTLGGSGYDVACANANGPIIYRAGLAQEIVFSPRFKEGIYFVHLNQKQDSRDAVARYRRDAVASADIKEEVGYLTDKISRAQTLDEFIELLKRHENLLSKVLDCAAVHERLFSDFEGAVKSLGAWGGDFVLACSNTLKREEVFAYFKGHGYNTILTYDELIL